jgi:hypothetical protein
MTPERGISRISGAAEGDASDAGDKEGIPGIGRERCSTRGAS